MVMIDLMTSTSSPRCLVTGAASGLGRALVGRLSDSGWRVAEFDIREAEGGRIRQVDVADAGQVQKAVDDVVTELGGLDAAVNCAGVFHNNLSPVHTIDDAAWALPLQVNLTGSFNLARAVLPQLMISRGVLVLVASTAADHPQPGGAAYAASKAGVRALARSVALEYGPRGVRACSVSPGYMRTAMTAKALSRDDIRTTIENSVPLGRTSDPAEVAAVIAFLVGSDAAYLTGSDITVDGGGGLMAYSSPDDIAGMWSRVQRRQQTAATS